MKTKHILMLLIALFTTISFCGCIENADTAVSAASYTMNQDTLNELDILVEQLSKTTNEYSEASANYNEATYAYNDFIYEYNDMNYFQQTSSSTVNKKARIKQEYRAEARNLIVQCDIMDSQINDIMIFLESNRNALMNIDSQYYYELRNNLVELKAGVKSSKSVATDALYL